MSAKRTAGYEARADKIEQARAERQRQVRAAEERERARRQRVADIARKIGRDKARIDEIEAAIRAVEEKRKTYTNPDFDQVDMIWPPRPLTRRDKEIALSLGKAVGKLEKQLRRHDGGGVSERQSVINRERQSVINRALSGDKFSDLMSQLKGVRHSFEIFGGKEPDESVLVAVDADDPRFEAFGGKPGDASVLVPMRQQSLYDTGPPWPLARLTVDQLVKRDAAATAAKLFKSHGLKPTATRKSEKTKASDFVVVAALLYGDKHANLYPQCRTIVEEARAAAAASPRRRWNK